MVRVILSNSLDTLMELMNEQWSLKRELHTHCSGEMVPREAAIMSTTVETFTLEADVKDLKRLAFELHAEELYEATLDAAPPRKGTRTCAALMPSEPTSALDRPPV